MTPSLPDALWTMLRRPHLPFDWVVAASTLLDALVAVALLFRNRQSRGQSPPPPPPPPIAVGELLRAAGVTGVFFSVKLLVLSSLGAGLFGKIHLIYTDAVVLLPALGAALLIIEKLPTRSPRPPLLTPSARLALVACVGLAGLGVYASLIEPFRLQVERADVRLDAKRRGTGRVKIGVVTDLQTTRITDYELSAIDRLMAERPDVILLPGDVFQGRPREFEPVRAGFQALFRKLSAPGGVYLVLGDTDRDGRHLLPILRECGVRLLVNQIVRVQVGGRRLTIGGIELKYASAAARELIARMEQAEDEGDVRILVAHRPDVALGLTPHSRIDLVVAGHTHGGQIVVPGYGPPVTLSNVPRRVAAGGLHAISDNLLYVSRGVGCERGQAPRIRFLCPPEISVLEIGGTPRQ